MNILNRKLTPTERRSRVALGVRLGKSNRAIAKELGVDERTVRRDRKLLKKPKHLRAVKKERSKRPKKLELSYDPDDPTSVERQFRLVSEALRL